MQNWKEWIMKEIRYPSDWRSVCFDDICYINKKSLSEKTPENYMFRYIDLSSVDKGVIKCTDRYIAFKDAPCRARRIIQKNDIIMSTVRPNLQSFAFIDFDPVDVICSTGFAVLTAKQQMCNKYIYQLLYSKEIETQINNMLVGSNYPAINSSDVASLKICIPPFAEQKKIAEILGTWDLAIEELTGLIAEKKELKRGLMQRLLTGTQRLPGFTKPWKKIKLTDVLEECVETTTTNNQYEILTSSRRGIFRQEDYFDKQVASQDNIGYKIIRNGDFTYRAMTDDDKFCFNQLTDFEIGIVSPAYAVFRTKKIPGNILKFILNSERFGYELLKEAQGGTRKSLKYNSLIKLQIYVPDDEEEMARLSECLHIADSEIDLLNQQLDVLREQKRGLMQKLLTGEIRVKVDTETC